MKLKKKIIYLAQCPGQEERCKLSAGELKSVQPGKGIPRYRVCQEHGGIVTGIEIECLGCGEVFEASLYSCRRELCDACIEAKAEEKRLKDYEKQVKIELSAFNLSKERVDAEAKKTEHMLLNLNRNNKTVEKRIQAARLKLHSVRGEYCVKFQVCKEGNLKCRECEEFTPFPMLGIDPALLGCYA